MTDFIIEEIKKWLKAYALGRENAKPRKNLRMHVIYNLHYGIGDRALRRAYSKFNHVGYSSSDPKGIFWIDDPRDFQKFKDEQSGRAVAIFTRTKETQIAIEEERQPGLY